MPPNSIDEGTGGGPCVIVDIAESSLHHAHEHASGPSSDKLPTPPHVAASAVVAGLGGAASLPMSVFNLTNTSVGAGVLALPFFFRSTGLLLGSIVMITVAIMSAFSLRLLVDCGSLGVKGTSYADIAAAAFGRVGTKMVQLVMFLLTFGAITSYFIIIGTLGCQTIEQLSNLSEATGLATALDCHDPATLPWYARREFVSAAFMLLILPLSLLRNMSALGFASFLSLGAVFYMVVLVVQDGIRFVAQGDQPVVQEPGPADGSNSNDGIQMVILSPKFFFALPIICLAFLNHTNINGIVDEMARPTRRRVQTLIFSSTSIAMVFYAFVGIVGYLRFGAATPEDILMSYRPETNVETVLFALSRLGMVLCLALSMPLLLFPSRSSLHELLVDLPCACTCKKTAEATVTGTINAKAPKTETETSSRLAWFLETLFILLGTYGTAVAVPAITTVFGLTGSITGCTLVYVLPPAFYLRLRRRALRDECDDESGEKAVATRWRAIGAWVVLVLGSLISVMSTGAILYQIIMGEA